ncbi:MAG TPA: hypothetical protein VIN08_05745 [Ohtaekwangia sp.]|uniref:Gldg family protein n=1 Tax=Ohtaekwangia sp. TaxID=2066019 RepID=UPI002F942748
MKTTTLQSIVTNIAGMLVIVIASVSVKAQPAAARQHVLVDVSHGQIFWFDPAVPGSRKPDQVERIKYLNGELVKNATAFNADVSYSKGKLTPDVLAKTDVLFIHIPSAKYETDEVKAIQQYLQKGGSLLLVMDADYWSTLEQVNANDILSPYGIQFGKDSPIAGAGGLAKISAITPKELSIPYHGARLVNGGTPFCYSKLTKDEPFGTFTKLKSGGKIVAMGEGMVSLYMTSWEGVNNYQCSEFMGDVLGWLLK